MADYDKLIKGAEDERKALTKRIDALTRQGNDILERTKVEIGKINKMIKLCENERLRLQGQVQAYEKLRKDKSDPKKTTVKQEGKK